MLKILREAKQLCLTLYKSVVLTVDRSHYKLTPGACCFFYIIFTLLRVCDISQLVCVCIRGKKSMSLQEGCLTALQYTRKLWHWFVRNPISIFKCITNLA